MKKCWVILSGSVVAIMTMTAPLLAQFATLKRPGLSDSQLTICLGEFALCAASICKPDGKKIAVNGTDQLFDEAQCTCPILEGPSFADVNGGNMKGSCIPPSVKKVWSTYSPRAEIPQEINGWKKHGFKAEAPAFVCPANKDSHFKFTNCFSFECTRAGKIHNVPVATCYCPIQEFDGKAIDPGTPFGTQAGQCNLSVCSKYPVSGVFPLEELIPGACIDLDHH